MPKSIAEHSDQGLRNVIDNHRKAGRLREPYFLEALEELARRKGGGLNFQASLTAVKTAASERRFLSYKQLADASGADWAKVRYAVNTHLGDLLHYAHGKQLPLLSAIVVNQPNVETGKMEPLTLKGFITACRALGYAIDDEQAFLEDQQRRVFAWAEGAANP